MEGLTSAQLLRALVVEVIHNLWHAKLYRGVTWLRELQQAWHSDWVLWKTLMTMKDVDRQIEEMRHEPEIDPPLYWSQEEGETPLGGPLGYDYEFDNAPGGADPVQGAE